MTVSVALVAIASLCARHVVQAASRDTGLDLDRLALARFDFKVQGWPEARARRALDRLADEAGRQNGTEAVAIVSGLPLHRLGRSASLTTPDRPFAANYYGQCVTLIAASPSVFNDPRHADRRRPLVRRARHRREPRRHRPQRTGGAQTLRHHRRRRTAILRRRPPSDGPAGGVDPLTVIGVAGDTDSGDGGPGDGTAYVPFSQNYEPS